jgi:hypothetical protein
MYFMWINNQSLEGGCWVNVFYFSHNFFQMQGVKRDVKQIKDHQRDGDKYNTELQESSADK